jgi:hypothetical protein
MVEYSRVSNIRGMVWVRRRRNRDWAEARAAPRVAKAQAAKAPAERGRDAAKGTVTHTNLSISENLCLFLTGWWISVDRMPAPCNI